MSQILVVEDEPVIRGALRKLLERHNYLVAEAESVEDALERPFNDISLIISDLRLPGAPGTDLIDAADSIPVLIMTSYASLRSAVDAMKQGAVDYIAKPFDHDEMLLSIKRILDEQQQQRRTRALSADMERSYPTDDIIGESKSMRSLLDQIEKLAPSDTNLLLVGESGTGKELMARSIHQHSHRQQAPIIVFSCGASAGDSQEAELFGYEEGAVAGLEGSRRGLAEEAHGGTLFIDEVGELTPSAQARLLHLLDKSENSRIGSVQGWPVDIRLITSSQTDLLDKVNNGEFRNDLYFRIKGAELFLPPLRERDDDILLLANSILSRVCERLNSGAHYFTKKAKEAMQDYLWPGNVRELVNAIERAIILADKPGLVPKLLGINPDNTHTESQPSSHEEHTQDEVSLKDYFTRFVLENQSHMTETALARKLGISRKSLWERRQRYGIPRKKTSQKNP